PEPDLSHGPDLAAPDVDTAPEEAGPAAAQQLEQRALQAAIRRGDFENLPGAGKPIRDLGDRHDPNWWTRRLIEREQITAVLPPALAIRKEVAELDVVLDRET